MYYQGFSSNDETYIKFEDEEEKIEEFNEYATKIRFESNEDFIFSYSIIDSTDEKYNKYEKWNDDIIVSNDLRINEITQRNNLITIKFKPNYRNSATKYIIIIAPKDQNNILDNFKDPCYLTKLVNEKAKGVKIMNHFVIGEKDSITTELDISDILNSGKEYIVNIISQELRYNKKIYFYEPKTFQNNEKEEDKNGNTTLYIVLISVFGAIILIIALFFIIRYLRKKKKTDFDISNKIREISNEKLMDDI